MEEKGKRWQVEENKGEWSSPHQFTTTVDLGESVIPIFSRSYQRKTKVYIGLEGTTPW